MIDARDHVGVPVITGLPHIIPFVRNTFIIVRPDAFVYRRRTKPES